jgi:hypothetical protein
MKLEKLRSISPIANPYDHKVTSIAGYLRVKPPLPYIEHKALRGKEFKSNVQIKHHNLNLSSN